MSATQNQAQPARPLRILATYIMDAENVSTVYADELHELATNAARAISEIGRDVQVWLVDAARPGATADELVSGVDGVLVLGGSDVDPSFYTSDPEALAQSDHDGLSPAADENEIALVRAARAKGLPVMGICRGMQLINVAFGGTLIPDLGAPGPHNSRPDGDEMVDHPVQIVPESILAGIYGSERVGIRSAHHQAVDRVAESLRVSARADDGVIEAVEANDDSWLVAVQWHPEDRGANPEDLRLLARALVSAARAYREA